MANKTPLQTIKDDHGGKAALIDKVLPLIDNLPDESDDDCKKRLAHVANRKLLHLLEVGEKAKALGGRDGLVKTIAELKGQPKDHEYTDRLKQQTLGQLVDQVAVLQKQAKAAAK
ncbi:MAG: hypothetical protein AAF721_38175 [Myxococcota bacterium]